MTDLDSASYPDAVRFATTAAAAYYGGETSSMTDLEYDQILADITAFELQFPEERIQHSLFTRVAAGTLTGDVPHPTPMLSLEKVTDEAGIRKFLQRVAGTGTNTNIAVQPKLDGLAIRAVYRSGQLVQVVTRGNGQAGEDVTERIMRDQVYIDGLPTYLEEKGGIPIHADAEVRGELLMTVEDFATSNANRIAAGKDGFANPRNAAAGSLRAETLDYDVEMTFVTYEHDNSVALDPSFIYADKLPSASKWMLAENASDIIDAVEDFGAERPDYPYPTDGIVLKASDAQTRAALGAGSRAPKWAVAYKYEAQTGESVIRDILVDVGRTGNLSFTAVFDPVLVDGSTISRASLHNVEQIQAKDIRIGSKAVVYKANDIIPQVLSVTNGDDTTPWVAPTEDEDGYPYDQGQVIWRSTNPTSFLSGLIAYAASRDVLDIDGLGQEIADALVEEGGVQDISDLFTLDLAELSDLPLGTTKGGSVRRLGAATATKIVANIDKARTQPLNRVITALGIRQTGRTFGRRLAAHFKSLEALMDASIDDLMQVEGVGEGRACVISDGLGANREVIRKLIELGVTSTVEDDSTAPKPLVGENGKPLSVVVTGAMTGPLASYGRTQMNELIDQYGGKASGSVSKNTGLLVCGEEGSSKWQKATDLGVRIVTPEEFAAMVGL